MSNTGPIPVRDHSGDCTWCVSPSLLWLCMMLFRSPCMDCMVIVKGSLSSVDKAPNCRYLLDNVFFIFMNELYCFTLSISSKMNKNSLKFNRVNTIRTFKRYIILCFTVRKNSHLKDFCGADDLYPTRYPHLLFLCICDYEHTGRYIFGWPIVTW